MLICVRDGGITTALILEMLSYFKQNPSDLNKAINDSTATMMKQLFLCLAYSNSYQIRININQV